MRRNFVALAFAIDVLTLVGALVTGPGWQRGVAIAAFVVSVVVTWRALSRPVEDPPSG